MAWRRRMASSAAPVVIPPTWRHVARAPRAPARGTPPSERERERPPRRGPISLDDDPSSFRASSRSRLMASDARRFTGDGVFDRVARAVCVANCLPRKELFETWEAAVIIGEHFCAENDPDAVVASDASSDASSAAAPLRVLDLAAGHGLLAQLLLVLHPDAIHSALCVDRRKPDSFDRLRDALVGAFPETPSLRGKTRFVTDTLANVRPTPDTLLVSVHACGSLTDYVLDLAIEGRSPVAVVPCCHRVGAKALRDAGADAWDWVAEEGVDAATAIDVMRLDRLRSSEAYGGEVEARTLSRDVTAMNRMILGKPRRGDGGGEGEGGGDRGWEDAAKSLPDSPWSLYAEPPR